MRCRFHCQLRLQLHTSFQYPALLFRPCLSGQLFFPSEVLCYDESSFLFYPDVIISMSCRVSMTSIPRLAKNLFTFCTSRPKNCFELGCLTSTAEPKSSKITCPRG